MGSNSQRQFAPAPTPMVFAPTGVLQRKCDCGQHTISGRECSDCQDKHLSLQRATRESELATQNSELDNRNSGGVPPIVYEVLRSPGQPLDAATRAFFEPRFGHDFSGVRVHTDAKAGHSAHAVNALAYTVGQDIVLGGGARATGTIAELKLLAHELTHVLQQTSHGRDVQTKLKVSETGNSQEREADMAAQKIFRGESFHPREVAHLQISRMPVEGSAASVSWIDPSSPAGSSVPDPEPPPRTAEPFVTGNSGFRFSNYLHAAVETPDSVRITSSNFRPNSGIYRGPSKGGISSLVYPTRQSKAVFNEGGIDGVEFEQLAGARTISPAVIGGTVGAAVGIGAGAYLGAKGGALIGALGGPIGAGAGAVIGGIVGGIAGWLTGSAVANRIKNFPPIWTRIKLRLSANGKRHCELVQHSRFPCSSFYCDLSRVSSYGARAPEQTAWENSGWDGGNPWGAPRPLVGQ